MFVHNALVTAAWQPSCLYAWCLVIAAWQMRRHDALATAAWQPSYLYA